jgi:signal transduction histidine kinase
VKLLSNPIVINMVLAALAAFLSFALFFLVRAFLRKNMLEATEQESERPTEGSGLDFGVAAYHGLMQKLKEQEQELARLRQAERLRATQTEIISGAILGHLTSGVLLFNTSGLVQQANNAAKSILGYASPLGFHARDLFRGVTAVRSETQPGGSSDDLVRSVEACIRNSESFRRLEADYQTPQGERRVLGVTLSPVREAAGGPMGAACLVSDLTEISELNRQMRLRENLASLGEMSAGIAHEFKNSLATISGYAQMLQAENDAATVQVFAKKMEEETGNLTRIVTDFLAFARPQGGDAAGSATLLREVDDIELRPMLEECARSYDLDLDFVAGFPADCRLRGDRTALRQVFSNLLRNSAEAARNGARPRVRVSAERSADALRLVLQDNGEGIPQEQLSKIFIPFFTTKARGTGLGLALVHRVVSEHGGTVTVASDSSGASFTLTFPLAGGSGTN